MMLSLTKVIKDKYKFLLTFNLPHITGISLNVLLVCFGQARVFFPVKQQIGHVTLLEALFLSRAQVHKFP